MSGCLNDVCGVSGDDVVTRPLVNASLHVLLGVIDTMYNGDTVILEVEKTVHALSGDPGSGCPGKDH